MIRGLALSIAVLISMGAADSFAVEMGSAFSQVPSRFRTQELTLGSRGLGEICYSRALMPDGTVCNPAFLPEVKDPQLLFKLFVGNGYAALNNADQFINQPLTREYMQSLFTEDNVISVEANVGLSFTAPNFFAAYSPYRVQYASEIHNPNLPVVSVHAAIEKSFVIGGGMNFREIFGGDERFSFGTRVRLLERKFVHGSFSLLQATTEDPRDYLPSQKHQAILADPSFGFVALNDPHRFRVSIGAQNLGYSQGGMEEYPDDPDVFGGVGGEIPVKYGQIRLGIDFVDLFHAETVGDRFRFGGSYKIGLIEAMLGANSRALTAGVQYAVSFIQAGIVYEFVRDDLEQGGASTRLATEVGFKI